MGNGTSYSTVNSLDEFTLIGGNDFTIIFNVVDEAGLPVDLTNAEELSLKISPYGQATSVLMTLSGVIGETNDIVKFTIPANLSERMIGGKYMYQPIIKDAEGKQHRPKQGTFLLVQSIGTFTDLVDVPSSAFYVFGSGTNTYTAESNVITQYYDGLTIILHVENTNTLASTLTFDNAPGTRDIKKFTSSGDIVDLSAGDLVEGKKYLLVYDGIQWISISTFDSGGGGTFYVYATGTDSYTGTSTEINQYFAGLSAIMYFQNTNTGTSTLTLPGVAGTKSLMKFNSSGTLVELIAGDILQNKKYLFLYDGTQWVYVGYFPSEISHTKLTDIGTNTHAQIDTFIGTTVPSTYAPLASPTFTGNPTAPTPTAGDNDTSIATTAFVNNEIANDRPYSDTNPLMNGTVSQGVSPRVSRQDHVHPTDTSRAPLASPALTGTPTAPTAATSTNTTQLATTAFVQAVKNSTRFLLAFASYNSLASPISTSPAFPYAATLPSYTIYPKQWSQGVYIGATNNASNYWVIDLIATISGSDSVIATVNTSALGTNAAAILTTTTFSQAFFTQTNVRFAIRCTIGAGAPSNLHCHGPALEYQLAE